MSPVPAAAAGRPTGASPSPEAGETDDVLIDHAGGLTLSPAFELSFPAQVHATLSPDGEMVAVAGFLPRGRRSRPGIMVLDRLGGTLWQADFAGDARSFWVGFVAQGRLLAATAAPPRGEGTLCLFRRDGSRLLTTSFNSPASVAVDPDGDLVAIVNPEREWIELRSVPSGNIGRRISVAGPASVAFAAGGDILVVHQQGRVTVVDVNSGETEATYRLQGVPLREMAVLPDGQRLAVTTADPDSALYLFTGTQSWCWRRLLVPGGRNHVACSPGGGEVAVYDVGDRAGLCVFEAPTGALRWRRFCRPAGAGVEVQLREVALQAAARYVLADYVLSPVAAEEGEHHVLCAFDGDGSLLWQSPLGENVDVSLAAGHHPAALIVDCDTTAGWSLPTTVRYHDLSRLLPTPGTQEIRAP